MEIVSIQSSVNVAARAVLASACRTVFVVDDRGVLRGSVSEGDLVKAFLRGLNTDSNVRHVMNSSPLFVKSDATERQVAHLLAEHGFSAIPVVDEEKRVVKVFRQIDVAKSEL